MKTSQAWRVGMADMQILPGPRHRPPLRRPMWIIILVLLVTLFLICAYMYPPQSSAACYVFSSRGCMSITDWLPPAPAREFTDEELASHVVIKDILNSPPILSHKSKIAFMFLTPGSLPFEKLWEKFFHVSMAQGKIFRTSGFCKNFHQPILWHFKMTIGMYFIQMNKSHYFQIDLLT